MRLLLALALNLPPRSFCSIPDDFLLQPGLLDDGLITGYALITVCPPPGFPSSLSLDIGGHCCGIASCVRGGIHHAGYTTGDRRPRPVLPPSAHWPRCKLQSQGTLEVACGALEAELVRDSPTVFPCPFRAPSRSPCRSVPRLFHGHASAYLQPIVIDSALPRHSHFPSSVLPLGPPQAPTLDASLWCCLCLRDPSPQKRLPFVSRRLMSGGPASPLRSALDFTFAPDPLLDTQAC